MEVAVMQPGMEVPQMLEGGPGCPARLGGRICSL